MAVIGDENVFASTPRLGESMNAAAMAAYHWLGQEPGALAVQPSDLKTP
jgi:hypothetical protein